MKRIDSPQYDAACEAATHIVNVLDNDQPKAVKFGRILFTILQAIYLAQRAILIPSEN